METLNVARGYQKGTYVSQKAFKRHQRELIKFEIDEAYTAPRK